MDPDFNLSEQDELLQEMAEYEKDQTQHHPAYENARQELADKRRSLWAWLRSGGFAPDWSKFPRTAAAFKDWSLWQ